MRRLFTGDIARFALAAIAAVSTVGLFVFLALNEPRRVGRSPDNVSTPEGPALELRRETLEPPETPKPTVTVPPAAAPLTAPALKEPPESVPETTAAPEPPLLERADIAATAKSVSASRGMRKSTKLGVEPRTSTGKRPLYSGASKTRASFGSLPNKKCGEHEEREREAPPADPFLELNGFF
jgi:hypothetical protein